MSFQSKPLECILVLCDASVTRVRTPVSCLVYRLARCCSPRVGCGSAEAGPGTLACCADRPANLLHAEACLLPIARCKCAGWIEPDSRSQSDAKSSRFLSPCLALLHTSPPHLLPAAWELAGRLWLSNWLTLLAVVQSATWC